jgi:hypothetical protein
MLDPAIGYLLIIGGALLLAAAGVHKLRDLGRFTEVFIAYRVLPAAAARRAAGLIPVLELAVAFALLVSPSRRWPIAAAIGLLLAYAAGLALNLARGRLELDCGCSTLGGRRPIAAWMVWRNLGLACALGAALGPWALRPLGGTDLLTIAGGVAAAAILYAAIDRLLGDVAPRALTLRSSS